MLLCVCDGWGWWLLFVCMFGEIRASEKEQIRGRKKQAECLTYKRPVAEAVYGSTVAGVPTRMMNIVVLYDMVVTLVNRT